MRFVAKAVLAVTAGGAIAASLAGTALADPATTPAVNDIVGVGSDTTQNVLNQLQTDYNQDRSTGLLASWNAFVPSTQADATTIVEKAGCPAVTRPAGSGAGIADLKLGNRPEGDTTNYCVDFARSSRGPQAADAGYSFVRLAQDAVTWAKTVRGTYGSNAPASLSNVELRAIFSCDASILGKGATGPVRWNQVGAASTDLAAPILPQASSGTRSFFLNAIGVSTVGSCVQQPAGLEENQGKAPSSLFTNANTKNYILPYSVAVYLAQSQNGKDTGRQGSQVLGNAESTSGSVIGATVGSAGSRTINPGLASVGLTRFVYNVVRGTSTPVYLKPIVGSTGYFCKDATAQADIAAYGFRNIGSQCGTVQPAA